MKAIVCDCCGKVILLEDGPFEYSNESGVHHLISRTMDYSELDLCQECADKLMDAVHRNVPRCNQNTLNVT